MKLLDIDTGGGEFLLSLNHPYANTGASEAYPPNAALCEQTLLPLGIDFRPGDGKDRLPFPEQYLKTAAAKFEDAGFSILERQECFRPIRFFDVGALVWFARIIEWEFPGFSVERCTENLLHAQQLLEQNGFIEGRIHRFLLTARKP